MKLHFFGLLPLMGLAKSNLSRQKRLVHSKEVGTTETKTPWLFTIKSRFDGSVDGQKIPDSIDEFQKKEGQCSAVLYKPNALLTVAHCVVSKSERRSAKYASEIKIFRNQHRRVQDFFGKSMVVHPNYNLSDWNSAAGNDIAIIFFDHHGKLGEQDVVSIPAERSPINMLETNSSQAAGRTTIDQDLILRVFGYRQPDSRTLSSDSSLNFIDVEIMQDNECQTAIGNFHVDDSQFCVKPNKQFLDSMLENYSYYENFSYIKYNFPSFGLGDSGSPLMKLNRIRDKKSSENLITSTEVTNEVYGLVSLMVNEEVTDVVSGVATDLNYHARWIEEIYQEFGQNNSIEN